MKKLGLFLSTTILALAAISCSSSNKEAKEEKTEEPQVVVAQTPELEGYWRLTEYVGVDGTINEVPQQVISVLHFNAEDHNFGFTTDCNGIGGHYKTEGDSIRFEEIARTEMACPSMVIEEAMNAMLPRIDTYAINPDTILRLRSDMRIMATFVKTSKEEIKAATEI